MTETRRLDYRSLVALAYLEDPAGLLPFASRLDTKPRTAATDLAQTLMRLPAPSAQKFCRDILTGYERMKDGK